MYGSDVCGIYDKSEHISWEKTPVIERTHDYYFSKLDVEMNLADYHYLKEKNDINIIKFWLHVESFLEDNVAKRACICPEQTRACAGQQNQLS